MIQLAKKKLSFNKYNKKNKIELKCKNVLKINKFEKSNLFISMLLFPFLNYEERKKLLKKFFNNLNRVGAFFSVEKLRAINSNYEDILNQMYFDYKLKKKLNEKEILNKAKSLRSSMYLFNEKKVFQLLRDSNFNNSEIFFRCFNFIGYIAIK